MRYCFYYIYIYIIYIIKCVLLFFKITKTKIKEDNYGFI